MILLYKGISTISRTIKFVNWGDFSHASWKRRDDSVIEAWHVGGVRHTPHYCVDHTPGTVIEAFKIRGLTDDQQDRIEEFLLGQVGKKYDYRGVLRFLSRRDPADTVNPEDLNRWFCSVLVFCAVAHVRDPLLARVSPHRVHPTLLSYSPDLVHVGTLTTWRMSHEQAAYYASHRVPAVA